MNVLKKSILASIGVVLLALTLALTNVAQAVAAAVKDVVVVNTTSNPVPVVAQGTTAIKGTVGLDPAANTVKLDAAANTVRAQQSGTWNVGAQQNGTWNVGITNSSVPVSGTVNVGNQPAFAFDANGNLKTIGSVGQGRAAAVVLNTSGTFSGFLSPDLSVGQFTELAVDITITTCFPGGRFDISRKGADGRLYVIDSVQLPANGSISRSLGVGAPQNVSFGNLIQVLLQVICPPAPASGWTLSVIGK